MSSRKGTVTKTATHTKTVVATLLVVGAVSAAAAAGFVSLKNRADQALVLPGFAFQSSSYVPGYVQGYVPGYAPGYSVPGYVPEYGVFQKLTPALFELKKREWIEANISLFPGLRFLVNLLGK